MIVLIEHNIREIEVERDMRAETNKVSMRQGIIIAALALALLIILVIIGIKTGSTEPAQGRKYQNPPVYVQIVDEISTHGYDYYTSPVLTSKHSSRSDHVDAMIKTAYKYLGDPFVNRQSAEPGKGVDCSGLVMQACYGAGVDLWPSNPYRHQYGEDKYEWESREIAEMDGLRTIPYEERKRGDLIFYANSEGTVVHVAIYLGHGRIIHSSNSLGGVVITPIKYSEKAHICLVRRVFN